ncbi:MAG: type IA DNA topoisomerase, partial [Elusimicrobiota bacterium]
MAKKLLIVESPNKTKKIKSFLGSGYDVIASVGHFRDLPNKKIGVDTRNSFEPTYEIDPNKRSVVRNIVTKAKNASIIYLATDSDREGEAIAFHLTQIIPSNKEYKRVRYQSITKQAIMKAIEEASDIDMDLVQAYEARRILDRLVGYKCSYPVKMATGGISTGRVQSAVLRFLSDRELEIQQFVPITYWSILVELLTDEKEKIIAVLTKPEKLKISTEGLANKICDTLKNKPVKVSFYEKKETKRKPLPPFTASTLMQSASNIFGWGAKKTMQIA